jgi:hypothetical protein
MTHINNHQCRVKDLPRTKSTTPAVEAWPAIYSTPFDIPNEEIPQVIHVLEKACKHSSGGSLASNPRSTIQHTRSGNTQGSSPVCERKSALNPCRGSLACDSRYAVQYTRSGNPRAREKACKHSSGGSLASNPRSTIQHTRSGNIQGNSRVCERKPANTPVVEAWPAIHDTPAKRPKEEVFIATHVRDRTPAGEAWLAIDSSDGSAGLGRMGKGKEMVTWEMRHDFHRVPTRIPAVLYAHEALILHVNKFSIVLHER